MADTDSITISQQQFNELITRYFIHSSIPLHYIEDPHFKNVFSLCNIDKLGLNVMSSSSLKKHMDEAYTRAQMDLRTKLKRIKHVCITSEHVSWFQMLICHWIGSDLRRHSHLIVCRHFQCNFIDFKKCDEEDLKKITGIRDYKNIIEEEQQNIRDDEWHNHDSVVVSNDSQACNNRIYVQFCIYNVIKIDAFDNVEKTVKGIINKWDEVLDALESKSAQIQDILGHSITRPKYHKYRYFFNAYHNFEQILLAQDKYNELQTALELKKPLVQEDFVFITEYVKLIKPFVVATEILSDDNKEYFYGFLLPCLLSLRKKLIRLSNENYDYVHFVPAKCLEQFEEQFAEYFSLSTDVAVNAAIAAISHPKFKDKWFSCIDSQYHEKIRSAFEEAAAEEMKNRVPVKLPEGDDDFFEFKEGLDKTIDMAGSVVARYLTDNNTDMSMLHRHEEIKMVFIKYNTPLSIRSWDYHIYLDESLRQMRSVDESEELLQKVVLLKYNNIM